MTYNRYPTMQPSTSYDPPSPTEHASWADWMRPSREANSSWDSSLIDAFGLDSDRRSIELDGSHQDLAIPVEFTLTPPTPGLDSDQSSSSRYSIETVELEDLPEIPFISASHSVYADLDNVKEDEGSERHLWSGIIRPGHERTSSDRSIALLGQTTHRVLSPTRHRAPSVSSIYSRSKPAPAKSILSSNASIRTRTGGKTPSVKFLDMPTIHYEDDEDEEDPSRTSTPKPSDGGWNFGFIGRLFGMGKKSAEERTSKTVISGPYPLWDSPRPPPPREARCSASGGRERAKSLRSVRSNNSLRSVRSTSSRLQAYWGRLSGKDP